MKPTRGLHEACPNGQDVLRRRQGSGSTDQPRKHRVTGERERVAEVPPKCIQDGKTVYSSATSSDASFLLHLSPAPEPSANGASARRGQPERRREPSIDFTAVA